MHDNNHDESIPDLFQPAQLPLPQCELHGDMFCPNILNQAPLTVHPHEVEALPDEFYQTAAQGHEENEFFPGHSLHSFPHSSLQQQLHEQAHLLLDQPPSSVSPVHGNRMLNQDRHLSHSVMSPMLQSNVSFHNGSTYTILHPENMGQDAMVLQDQSIPELTEPAAGLTKTQNIILPDNPGELQHERIVYLPHYTPSDLVAIRRPNRKRQCIEVLQDTANKAKRPRRVENERSKGCYETNTHSRGDTNAALPLDLTGEEEDALETLETANGTEVPDPDDLIAPSWDYLEDTMEAPNATEVPDLEDTMEAPNATEVPDADVLVAPNSDDFACSTLVSGPPVSREAHEIVKEVGKHLGFPYKVVIISDPLRCGMCDNLYGTQEQLDMHIKRSHGNEIESETGLKKAELECIQCHRRFRNEANLRRHINTVHNGYIKAKCEHCGVQFSSSVSLAFHIGEQHGKIGKPRKKIQRATRKKEVTEYLCSTCGSRAGTKGNIIRHINIVHLKVREFQCEKCGKLFPTKNNMQNHQTSKNCQPKMR